MPIVAGGGRASTLHYTCNCEVRSPFPLRAGPGRANA
jgi:hypothetical protein